MMASFMSYFVPRKDPKASAREAIIRLRQQLQIIEKREEHLQKKINDELKVAKANAVSNKSVATAALQRKKASEKEVERLSASRLQLEIQVNTLESANLNAETMAAMKSASDALKTIHGNLTPDKVDDQMAKIQEQMSIADEIGSMIAMNPNMDMDEEGLKAELEELEQAELNDRLMEADHVPVHQPSGLTREQDRHKVPVAAVEDDEEAQLRELQASLAMA